jgi:SAM-dependent methyltransferase
MERLSHKRRALEWRARRALERQLDYQRAKSLAAKGHEQEFVAAMKSQANYVRSLLETARPLTADTRVLEVGSGAHGLIFYFGSRCIGVDPLAADYVSLFPWQELVPLVAANGEQLPFKDGAFEIVLCDNVVDHAKDPAKIVSEITRVLAPPGLLYFTVNFHHPIYTAAASLHSAWNAAGLHFEIAPFADHTVHLTRNAARRLFENLPLQLLMENCDIAEVKRAARDERPRHLGDLLKRVFFKNAVYEIVAVRR